MCIIEKKVFYKLVVSDRKLSLSGLHEMWYFYSYYEIWYFVFICDGLAVWFMTFFWYLT